MQLSRVLCAALLLALLIEPARGEEGQRLTAKAVLGGIYAHESPSLPECMDLLPRQASDVLLFVIEEVHLQQRMDSYPIQRGLAMQLIGLKGDARDFSRLRKQLLVDFKPRKDDAGQGDEEFRKRLTFIAALDYSRNLAGFVRRRVPGWQEYLQDLEDDNYWKFFEDPAHPGKPFPWRTHFTLRAHQYGETGEIETRLKDYLATIQDEEQAEEYRRRYSPSAPGESDHEQFERIKQRAYSPELNEHFEKVYRELPKEMREAFEKRMAKLKERK